MSELADRLNAYIHSHPFDSGESGCGSVLDQLYQAYIQTHEGDPEEIREGFQELEEFLCSLPLEDNDAVFTLCCNLCSIYQRMAFMDGLQYGARLMQELE